jgi:hypothetical protein
MANERCGRENMNIQSIVSAVINNLHLMPNSVNRVNSRLRAIPLFSFVLLFPGLRLNTRENGKKRRRRKEKYVNSNGSENADLKMRMLSLEMHFLSQGEEILSNPLVK